MTSERCLSLAKQQFPGWVVGWWECTEGRCGVEVTRRVGHCRYERRFWAGATWDEVLSRMGNAAIAAP